MSSSRLLVHYEDMPGTHHPGLTVLWLHQYTFDAALCIGLAGPSHGISPSTSLCKIVFAEVSFTVTTLPNCLTILFLVICNIGLPNELIRGCCVWQQTKLGRACAAPRMAEQQQQPPVPMLLCSFSLPLINS